MRHKTYPSNFDYLVPPRADTHIPNRSAGQILQAIDIRSGRRRQIRKPSDVRQPLLPTRYHLIDRLDSRDRLHVGGHAIDLLSVQPIAHSDRYLGKRVQDIQLRHRESGEPIHPDCVPDHDGVKPSASPRPPRRRAKLASEFPNPLGDRRFCFGGQGPIADPRRVRLHDAQDRIDRRGADADADRGAAGGRVGRRDIGIGAVIDIEQRALRAFEQD